ncbi:MAG: class I SAM-dependent methyltransferase [Ignavibacteria bacterium]|nr:class I SAM-dependent methyltransferase [Ignavibacteria bacterium]
MNPSDTRESIIERRGYRKNIVGDKFSLYISNYPVAVKYLKQRIGNSKKNLAELCCGVGVTLEYIGDAFKQVIGVDIDKKILDQCQDNLKSVGLAQRITLILGDINDDEIVKKIKADIAIYDIPFWSPHEYENQGDLTKKNPTLKSTIERIRKFITKDIIIFCSPKFDYEMITKEVGSCEFQKVFINGKYDRNHVYLGKLKQKDGITELKLST